jgi:hypothetical protein
MPVMPLQVYADSFDLPAVLVAAATKLEVRKFLRTNMLAAKVHVGLLAPEVACSLGVWC